MRRDVNNNDNPLSFNSLHSIKSALLLFYDVNDINIQSRKINRYLGEPIARQKQDRAYTREEIAKILAVSNERVKTVVLLMASTGMRIGSLSDLKVKHLQKVVINNNGNNDSDALAYVYKIMVYQGHKAQYYTFTSYECAKAIDSYLDYRRRCGESVNAESPLIREHFNPNNSMMVQNPKQIKVKAFTSSLEEILFRAGLTQRGNKKGDNIQPYSNDDAVRFGQQHRNGSKRHEVARAHGFRKFYNTMLIQNEVD